MKMNKFILCLAVFTACTNTGIAQDFDKIAHGKAVFERFCIVCHAAENDARAMEGNAGTYGLDVKYRGELPALLQDRTDLTAETIKVFIRSGAASMQPIRPSEVSDEDIEAIAAYLDNE